MHDILPGTIVLAKPSLTFGSIPALAPAAGFSAAGSQKQVTSPNSVYRDWGVEQNRNGPQFPVDEPPRAGRKDTPMKCRGAPFT